MSIKDVYKLFLKSRKNIKLQYTLRNIMLTVVGKTIEEHFIAIWGHYIKSASIKSCKKKGVVVTKGHKNSWF